MKKSVIVVVCLLLVGIFGWSIAKANSADIKDFYLPIQNTPTNPVDYNIYRNHEYKFSVHALEQWTPTVRNAVSGTANNGNDTTGSMVLRFNDH